jgi:pentafunctional AROM polypeptide
MQIGINVEGVQVKHHSVSPSSRHSPAHTGLGYRPQINPSIILVGLRGSGKTYNGRLATKALGWRFIDAGVVFEEKHGNLREFVRVKGWPAFWASEAQMMDELLSSRPNNHIISLGHGGGVVETPSAQGALKSYVKQGGTVIYLERDLEEVLEYLGEEPDRPQYTESNREVCTRRIPWFEEVSNHRLVSTAFIESGLFTISDTTDSRRRHSDFLWQDCISRLNTSTCHRFRPSDILRYPDLS